MYKHILNVLSFVLLLSTGGARAQEFNLTLNERSQEIFKTSPEALDLKQVQDMVVNDQIELKIAYQRVYQAQKKIGLARAQYFPYGLGTIGTMYWLNIWNPLILVELVTSLPSKWYNVQSEKNLRMAEEYSYRALRENLKNQIAALYYTILKEEAVLTLLKSEVFLLEQLREVYLERVALGLSTMDEVHSVELRILDQRDIVLKFSGYLVAEKAAFNEMIARNPEQAKDLKLQPVGDFLEASDYQTDLDTLVRSALNRSPELVAANYVVNAAYKDKKSVRWSILSFSGIGFGYWARINVAGSKIEQAKLNRELVETTLSNQVYVFESRFKNTLSHFHSEYAVYSDTNFYMNGVLEQFKAGEVSLDQLIEVQILYLKDLNEMAVAHYDALIKLNDFERAVLGDVKTPKFASNDFEVVLKRGNPRSNLSILSNESLDHIEKVEYVFDDASIREIHGYSKESGFNVRIYNQADSVISGFVRLVTADGEIIKKHFKFDI